jgi:capsular exopolysaccharide synthesis family protein
LLSVLLAGGIAYVVSGTLPKIYDGKVTLIVGQSLTAVNPDYNQLLTSQRLAQTYAKVATSRPILDRVIQGLGLKVDAQELEKHVQAEAVRDSTFIVIAAQDPDPTRAAAIANEVAQQLIAASPAIQGRQADVQNFIDQEVRATQGQIVDTEAELDRLTSLPTRTSDQDLQIQTLQNRLVSLRAAYGTLFSFSSNSASNLLGVIEPAIPPEQPSSPKILLNAILAAFTGLLLAAGIAFVVEFLDDTVKSPDDIEELTQLPTLGTILRMPGDDKRGPIHRLATHLYPRSPAAEAFRSLRTNVEFSSVDAPIRRLLVTSSIPGEGKTTTASNLAVAFAQVGRRTLLVDADMRKPGVHKLFDLANDRGLTDLLRGDDVDLAGIAHAVEQPNLLVITTGSLPPNPAELLASNKMQALMDRFSEEADLVILDSPPLQAVTDAAILSSMVDGTLLVVRAGQTRRGAMRQGLDSLGRVGANVLGVALNRLSQRTMKTYGYEGYEGSYYGAADGSNVPNAEDTKRPEAVIPEAKTR